MTKILMTAAAFLLLAAPVGAAQGHRAGNEVAQLERVAHRLENAAHYLYVNAKRNVRRPGPRQEDALCALEYLHERATRFRQRADRHAYRPHKLRRELRRLDAAFETARTLS